MEYKGRYRQTDAGKRVQQLEAELQTMRTRMKHMKRTLNSILNQDVISREALLMRQIPAFNGVSEQEAVTAALLHDVCKVGIYRRDKAGIYRHEDDRVLGHGAASVILIRQYMQLTDSEQVAILWHMGLYGDPDKAKTLGRAYNLYPLAMLIHHADMMATYYCDGKKGMGLV